MIHGAQIKALRIINFEEKRHPCEPLFTKAKILNLNNIITLNKCMLVFYHLNSIMFDDLFKRVKEQYIHNTRGENKYTSNIPKIKTSFYGSKSVQVKKVKH